LSKETYKRLEKERKLSKLKATLKLEKRFGIPEAAKGNTKP